MAKILLVEDDNNLREIYEARLQAEGYDIISAKDGEEALSIAKKEQPDLIISDVMMPRISGFEMLDILRNTDGLKEVKVIMLTALGQAEDKTRADKLGADRYLVKSQVTLEDIVKSASDLLAGAPPPAPTAGLAPVAPTPIPAPMPPAPAPVTPMVAAPVNTAPPVAPSAPPTLEATVAPTNQVVPTAPPIEQPVAPITPVTPVPVAPLPTPPVSAPVLMPPTPAPVAPTAPEPAPPTSPIPVAPAPTPSIAPNTPPAAATKPPAPVAPAPPVPAPTLQEQETTAANAAAQDTSAEEAAMQAQINSFIANAQPAPTGNGDAVMDAAVKDLISGTPSEEKPDKPELTIQPPAPTAPPEPNATPAQPSTPVPAPPLATPPSAMGESNQPQLSTPTVPSAVMGDSVTISNKKIIKPLANDTTKAEPNLHDLLAKEGMNPDGSSQAGGAPAPDPNAMPGMNPMQHQPGHVISPTATNASGAPVDPNSISL
ncbi:MAG TPA: response regulator [Patescibacteria group bacterium]|nr:response regulator [Patescibacteria group bacterium]